MQHSDATKVPCRSFDQKLRDCTSAHSGFITCFSIYLCNPCTILYPGKCTRKLIICCIWHFQGCVMHSFALTNVYVWNVVCIYAPVWWTCLPKNNTLVFLCLNFIMKFCPSSCRRMSQSMDTISECEC